MKYRKPCPLNLNSHITKDFHSGNASLDGWLRDMAGYNQEQNYTRTFVIVDNNNYVVGYYSLCAGMIYRSDVSRKLKGSRSPNEIPVATLARMAVDKKHQGKGLGAALLSNALMMVISASQSVAFRAVVVHAIDNDAEQFYKHYGFSETKEMERRLILSTKDIIISSATACHSRNL